MCKSEIVVKIALSPNYPYAPAWASMDEAGVVGLLRDMVYLRADGYVNSTGKHPGGVYTMLAGVSSEAYRRFRQNDDAFVKEVFGQDLYRDFGVMDISVHQVS